MPPRSAHRPVARTMPRPAPLGAAVSRRTLLGVTAAIPAVGLAAACGDEEPATTPDGGGPPDEVTYLTSLGVNANESYVYVAQAKGFFREANIECTIQPGTPGDGNHQALAGGAAEFAVLDSSGAFIRYARGGQDTFFQILAAIQQRSLLSFISYVDSGIRTPLDLEGRSIGIPAGSVTESLWPVYADLAGIDVSTVEVVPTSPQNQMAQLVGGNLDAVNFFVPTAVSAEAAGGGREASALPFADYLGDLYGNVLITTKSLIADNPDLVARFTNALMRGLEYTVANPLEAGEILQETEPTIEAEVSERQLQLMAPYVTPGAGEPVGAMDPERVARAVALLQSVGAVEDTSNLTSELDIMAWQFVPGADEAEQ